jgi:hypothetical protein
MIGTVLIGIGAGLATAALVVFTLIFISAVGRVKSENIALQRENGVLKETIQKQAAVITKMATEAATMPRPYNIHFSDEQIFHLAHLVIEHMDTLNGPKN